jgi:3-hydroxymyristoyl/3-hydroxydecanoyl-(acyl carrier protein) dehydratase
MAAIDKVLPSAQVWTVPIDHPALAGHFPGRPIVPGVVLLDQALLFAQAAIDSSGCVSPGVWQISQAKFLKPCEPGDELAFTYTASLRGGFSFVVRCAGLDVASGNFQRAPA